MTKVRSMPFTHPKTIFGRAVSHLLEAYLLGAVRIETGGTETEIPAQGSFVVAFAPHSGWIESIAIDHCLRMAGRAWPTWLTKEENRTLPRFITGDRAICVDRQTPEPGVMRTIYALLQEPNATLATAFEGTRFGNPQDPEDLVTLSAFKPGAVRIASRAQVPVLPVVVLGAERVAPYLDRVFRRQGILAAYRAMRHERTDPQLIRVRVLPLYRGHLAEGITRGKRQREAANRHTRILYEMLAARIRELDPQYPMGST
jgi:1-acyl-sn-glycerol-3-phosphate acyltransferase